MDTTLSTIGDYNSAIEYTDRPTVKAVIQNEGKILILNGGLLPGGGVDAGETNIQALYRELAEEIGATVGNVRPHGTIIQYRNILKRKYIVTGYSAELVSLGGRTKPQDDGEAQFVPTWATFDKALEVIENSIRNVSLKDMSNDANQGLLYNLMTSRELVNTIRYQASIVAG